MKNHNLKNSNRLLKSFKWTALSGLLLAMVGTNFADPITEDSTPEQGITIWVNDIQGMGSFRAEDVREDLLREAFYDAARREKWLGDYDFEYNGINREEGETGIELRVVDWSRSAAGMYNFRVVADFWNADGDKTSLGTFHGLRSSIAVFNGRDVGEQFAGSAEDAFRDALRKLKKKTIES
ncbi:hypothetical protein [Pelagicoccus sp. SDUM812002]|uniref:hypothetical protein n=1 Tax=Pelagicoccus sp. SDUM812002 TaxID=3041266 RepID=UPI00280CEA49|nr:hypothetical protein [Pelagicoccus sp. SDUM812002]MDQ8185857.1 hypothetical protein [Pelagicoccus sp. SDUM812002]